MNVAEFIARKNLDLDNILASVNCSLGMGPGDALLAVGSLAEGLGNRKSDLDLLLVTPRNAREIPSREVALVVEKCLFDVQCVRIEELQTLVDRLHEWAELPWNVTRSAEFTIDERRLMHRVMHGTLAYQGESSSLPSAIPSRKKLALLKLQVSRHLARTIQTDMAGNRDDGDYATLVLAAEELLGQAVDALAAAHSLTNPLPKWRSRMLDLVPADWQRFAILRPSELTSAQTFWSLHKTPQLGRDPVLAYALRIATFARAIFVWAERRLLDGLPALKPLQWHHTRRSTGCAPLPFLDLDVDFFQFDGGAALGRLNEFEEPTDAVELSVEEFEIALLCDGLTTPLEARYAAFGPGASEADGRIVEKAIERIGRAGLFVNGAGADSRGIAGSVG